MKKTNKENGFEKKLYFLYLNILEQKKVCPNIIDENYRRISSILRNREIKITGEPVADIFRNYSGIKMQSGRIRCLDPDTDFNGMTGTKLQKEIVEEYLDNPEKIKQEAKEIIRKYE